LTTQRDEPRSARTGFSEKRTDRTAAVVVEYKARDHLVQCLASLRAEGVERIVVADNGAGEASEASEAAVRAADPGVEYFRTGANLGMGTGTNRGVGRIGAEEADFLLCINPDAALTPGSLEAMLAAFDDRPELGIVGPRIDDPDGTLYPSARTVPTLVDAIGHAFLGLVTPNNRFTRSYQMLDWDHGAASDVDWVSGACFLIRRECWDAIGGFDEGYFMYAEDLDLCWRARRRGWEVTYEPAARVTHAQGVSTDRHPYRMIAEHHRALFKFAARSSEGWERLLLPLMAAGLVVRTPLAWAHRALAGRRHRAGRATPVR
jgi:N-acetylglucosaminyl-diphospho-decaprenol L-rhamnosyltransferase